MRLIKLEILNLASLDRPEGEVINFEEGALKDSTIFSIVGPTGSGKSTLLDAICLALYNRAPRYPKDGRKNARRIEVFGTPEEGENNRPAPTDNRNILTRGKKRAYSYLTFLANDGSLYCARWSVVRKVKNIDDPVTSLVKLTTVDGMTHEEEADWSTLPQIIGLEYEQFLRTVLIAQGSFANFLTSNENDRYELLEKLIGCEELYTSIAGKIRQKKEEATNAYTILNQQFLSYEQDIKKPEELQELLALIERLEEEERQLKAEMAQTTEWLNWYTAEEKHVENETKFMTAFLAVKQRLEAIQADVDRLTLHDSTLEAVGYYKEILAAQRNMQKQDKELQHLSEQIGTQENALQQEESRLNELVNAAALAEQQLNDQKPHIDRARVIKGELAIAKKTVNEKTQNERDAQTALTKATQAVKKNGQDIEKALADTTAAEEKLTQLKVTIEAETKRLQEAMLQATVVFDQEQQKSQGQEISQLQQVKELALKRQNDIKNALRVRKAMETNEATSSLQGERVTTLTERNAAIGEELIDVNRLVETLANECETLSKSYILITSENWKKHRGSLDEGKPCPLCGATHHPYADEKVLEPVVSDLKDLMDEKERIRKEKTDRKTALEKEMAQNEGECKTLRKSLDKLSREHQELQTEWSSLSVVYPDWPTDAEALAERKTVIDGEVQQADKTLNDYNALVKKVEKLRAAKEKAEKAYNAYRDSSANDQKAAEKKLSDAQALVQAEQGKTANLLQQQQDLSTAYDQACQMLSLAKEEVKAKEEAICQEIGQQDPDALEKTLSEAKNQADHAVQLKKETMGKIREAITGCQGKQETLRKARTTEQEKCEANRKSLEDWLVAYNAKADDVQPLTLQDIQDLYAATDPWEEIRQRHRSLSTAYTSAETTLKNEQKAHSEHQQQRPSQDKESLLARKAELEGHNNNALVEAKTQKQRHDAAVQQTGTLGAQKDAAEDLKNEWEQIANAIGADGKTLRKIAQCYTLRFLVEHANAEIRKFNNRYELQQVRNSLGIRVIDHDRADDVRDVTSLSGGETFIVSLGLALGLSALSSRNISFENLFIDEGFGTLDPDALDAVIDSLAMLQSSQGKKVGVISHTNTMSERITTQIRVIKQGHSGSSKIEVYP